MINRLTSTALAFAALSIAILSLGNTSALAIDWDNAEFYPFEKATLVYNVSGMQNGTQEMLIRAYGRESAQFMDSTMSMFGMNQQTKTASWTDKDWVYTYDYTTGTGSKIANPIQNFFQNTDDPKDAYMAFLLGMGGKEIGTDTHNGTSCTVYEIAAAGTKMCIADNLVMQYTRMNMMGMESNTELQSMDIGNVDSARFEKPAVEFNEVVMPQGFGMPGNN